MKAVLGTIKASRVVEITLEEFKAWVDFTHSDDLGTLDSTELFSQILEVCFQFPS